MANFSTQLVRDSRINDITDEPVVSVFQGAGSNTYQSFQATSTSSSNISFNVQLPSESIILDRNVLIRSVVNFRLTFSNVADTVRPFALGSNIAFQSFPLNRLFSTASAQINNTNVAINQQDVMDFLLLMTDPSDLKKYSGMTPYLRDKYFYNYTDAVSSGGDALTDALGFELDGVEPRGSFRILSATSDQVAPNEWLNSSGGALTYNIDISAEFSEPLFLSPFVFNNKANNNQQGIVGVNNFNLVLNIDSSLKRVFSYRGVAGLTATFQAQPFTNTQLLLNFLSPQPTDLIKASNSVPYYDFPRWVSQSGVVPNLPANSSAQVVSQNIQLNQIPELVFIGVRQSMSSLTPSNSSSFVSIQNISINFNNTSGLLASASQQDLYRMSVSNGLQMSWSEFNGKVNKNSNTNASPVGSTCVIPSIGGILVFNPAKDWSLPSYLSNGSIGQYNLQFNLGVFNQTSSPINNGELVVVVMNSGVFHTLNGASAIYTGLINKNMVLETAQKEDAVSSKEYESLVGGSLSSRVSSAMRMLVPRLSKYGRKPAPNVRAGFVGSRSGGVSSKLDQFA